MGRLPNNFDDKELLGDPELFQIQLTLRWTSHFKRDNRRLEVVDGIGRWFWSPLQAVESVSFPELSVNNEPFFLIFHNDHKFRNYTIL